MVRKIDGFFGSFVCVNRAHCYYLMALGNIGLGNREKAAGFIEEAVSLEPSHMMCRIFKKTFYK